MASSTRWRINISANNGNTYWLTLAEIEMRISLGGADQCSGGSASQSSYYTGYPGSLCFDDNTDTSWNASYGVTTGWVEYQFASAKEIVQYTLTCKDTTNNYPERMPKNWTLEYYDGGGWVAVDTRTNETGWGDETRTYDVPVSNLSVEVNDSVGAAENISTSIEAAPADDLSINVVDTVAVTENISLSYLSIVSINDTILVNELVSVGIISENLYTSVADTVTISEDYNIEYGNAPLDINTVDSVGIAEDVLISFDSYVSVYDVVSINENTVFSFEGYISVYDVVGVSEDVSISLICFVSVYDSVSVAESNVFGFVTTISVVDSVGLTEDAQFSFDSTIDVNDSVSIAESIIFGFSGIVSTYDEVTVSEVTGISVDINVSVVDAVSVSEDVSSLLDVNISVNDSVSLEEDTADYIELGIIVYDSVDIDEYDKLYLTYPGFMLAENVVIEEYVKASISRAEVFWLSRIDNITVQDVPSVYVSDLVDTLIIENVILVLGTLDISQKIPSTNVNLSLPTISVELL